MLSFCVHCGYRLDLGLGPQEGQRVHCPHCGAYLEIISLEPVELDWVYEGPFAERRRACQTYEYDVDEPRR